VKHKGDPVPTTRLEWVGRAYLVAVPLAFLLAAFTGHLVLGLVILMSLGAWAQWSIWVSKRRLANSVKSFSSSYSEDSLGASVD
jgi:uncharacterized membrane protein